MIVEMLDGPCEREVYEYGSPLPDVLVVRSHGLFTGFHDYLHTGRYVGMRVMYRHSRDCVYCNRIPVKDLDAS